MSVLPTPDSNRSRSARQWASCAFAAVLLSAGSAVAQTTPTAPQTPASSSEPGLDGVFARWDTDNTPGCTVGVQRGKGAPRIRAYGLAEMEHGVRARPDTVYEAGSVSKQVVAAAILLLVQDGRIGLDDDVRAYVPELPDYGTPITIRMLLNHTSGLRDWGAVVEMEGWPRGTRTVTNDDTVRITARQRQTNFVPGSEWQYTNAGYNLSAVIIQRITGQSLAEFTQERLFQPLGMTHSRWRDDFSAVVPGRAVAYGRRGGAYHQAMPFENAYGNGGMLTTVEDLLNWNRALDDGRLPPAMVEAMQERGTAGGRQIAYGLGLFVDRYRGVTEVAHAGSTAGYRAWLGRYPEAGLSIALLCNTAEADGGALGRSVAALYLPDRADPVAETGAFAEGRTPPAPGLFVGEGAEPPLTLAVDAEGYPTLRGQRLIQTGPDQYRMGSATVSVLSEDSLEVTTIDRGTVTYTRKPWFTPAPADLESFVGTYVSDEIPVRMTVSVVDNGLTLSRGSDAPQALSPAQADTFMGGPGTLWFQRDESGRVTTLHLNNGRIRDLRLVRVE